jgi:hypothetical protein
MLWRISGGSEQNTYSFATLPPVRSGTVGKFVLEIPCETRAVRDGAATAPLTPSGNAFAVPGTLLQAQAIINGRVAAIRSVDGVSQPPLTFTLPIAGWSSPVAPLLHQVDLALTTLLPYDDWKTTNLGARPPADQAPSADPDGDGATNEQEWHAGTNPLSAASVLSILSTAPQPNGALQVTFRTVAGKTYQLQTSSDLADFAPQGASFTTTGSSHTLMLPNASRVFFHLQLVSP